MTSLGIVLALLAPQDGDEKKFDASTTRLYVYDASRGVTLRLDKEGKIEFTVPEEDKESGRRTSKTYKAASAAEFRRQYPEVARKHGLDGYLAPRAVPQDEFDRWWDDLRRSRRLPLDPFRSPLDEDWQKWMDEQRKQFDELRKLFRVPGEPEPPAPVPPAPAPVPTPGGRQLGVKVDALDETLRDQLSLKEGEGVLISEVTPGSLAEKAGLRKHDVILKIAGKVVTDKWEFRKDVQEALSKPEFELEVARGGKRVPIKIKP